MKIIRKIKSKNQIYSKKTYWFKKWNYTACGLQVLLVLNILYLVIQASTYALSSQYIWQIVLTGIIELAMIGYIIMLIAKWKKINCSKLEKAKYIITGVAMVISITFIIYCDLYAFWIL